MTDKILHATNARGIIKVRVTDEYIAVRYSPDSAQEQEQVLIMALLAPNEEGVAWDNFAPVI